MSAVMYREMRDLTNVHPFEFEARNGCTPLSGRAARLYPGNPYLQAEWIRAVSVVRSTTNGWTLDRPVQKVTQ